MKKQTINAYCREKYNKSWRMMQSTECKDVFFKNETGKVVRLSPIDGHCYDVITNEDCGYTYLESVFEIYGERYPFIELGGE